MKLYKTILFAVALVLSNFTYAQYVPTTQDTTLEERYVVVDLKSGKQYLGYLVYEDDALIKLRTQNLGEITLKWRDIQTIKDINEKEVSKEGIYYEYNLQSTRYYFGPNGYGLKKGEGYYQNVWVLFNQVSYGFTDYFSASLGTVPLFLFAGAPTPVWVVPKVSVPIVKDKLNIGAGALLGGILGDDNTTFGIAFGSFTVGNRNSNLSLSLGYGMIDGDWNSAPVVTLSGMLRVSRKTYLITENYLFPSEVELSLVSIGGRSFAGKVGIDYGLVIPVGIGEAIALPWLGMTIPFGNY